MTTLQPPDDGPTQYGLVMVTAGTTDEAQQIAEALVTEKLAACVNILPIRSIYIWRGSLCNDSECQLLIKTDLSLFTQLAERVQMLHSYDVPEIVAVPIAQGADSYLSWMCEQLQ